MKSILLCGASVALGLIALPAHAQLGAGIGGGVGGAAAGSIGGAGIGLSGGSSLGASSHLDTASGSSQTRLGASGKAGSSSLNSGVSAAAGMSLDTSLSTRTPAADDVRRAESDAARSVGNGVNDVKRAARKNRPDPAAGVSASGTATAKSGTRARSSGGGN